MTHLEQLQNTISELENQSKTLQALSEVYQRAENTEQNYRQNLELFEKLRLQLESYENLLDEKIISIAKQNTDAASALRQTSQKVEQTESKIQQTKQEIEEQGASIEAHLKEVKSQNKAFYEQTQDLLVKKTDALNAQNEKFYQETTERIQNRLNAVKRKNEDFYTITSTNLASQLEKLDQQTTVFYERSAEGIGKNLTDFASHTKERDAELKKMLLLKIETIQEENKTLYIQSNTLFEKLDKTSHQFKGVLDKLSEFQMQFDRTQSEAEKQTGEIYNQSENFREAQNILQENQKQQFNTFSDYQKKALKYIYENQNKSLEKLKENFEDKFDKQSKQIQNYQNNLEKSISQKQKQQFVSLQEFQESSLIPLKTKITEELAHQNSRIEKVSTFQIITLIALLLNLALLLYLLLK